ncbi:MAG: metallophosphoesterase family protein [Hyphomicrobiales bacterium]
MGHITHPLLICGGAYGNLEALMALDGFAQSHGIPAHRIIHTGDAIAYCADARAAGEHLARKGYQAIFGNVEEQLAEEAIDCACGFEEGSTCDVLARSWYAHAQNRMTPELVRWMGELPAQLTFTMSGKSVRVVHGAPSQTNRFMWESLPEDAFIAEFGRSGTDIVIAGHTGIPFTRRFTDGCIWHNSGALGMPANDGTPRVWISLMTPGGKGPEFTHHPLEYDYETAARKMRAHGLPEGYAMALESGLWPSLDILPAQERRTTGIRRAA